MPSNPFDPFGSSKPEDKWGELFAKPKSGRGGRRRATGTAGANANIAADRLEPATEEDLPPEDTAEASEPAPPAKAAVRLA